MVSSTRQEILDAESRSSRKSRPCLIFPVASFLCVFLLVATSFFAKGYKQKLSSFRTNYQNLGVDKCKNQCRPRGSEALPKGIISSSSNLEMRPLWGHVVQKKNVNIDKKENASTNLFALAVGIRQKDLVNKMVRKFLGSGFVVMLFHYDGVVDEWKEFEWSDQVIHISAANQSKWYVSIIKSEGLEISQPALDPHKSILHHQITVRLTTSQVHRRTYKAGYCAERSTAPPCTGWVEIMAPVFSREAWRCVWYMVQNDLVHAWGLDKQLGYCAQGDRTQNVGVVDAEYIVHYGLPTLGGINKSEALSQAKDHRIDVRRLSFQELEIFVKRWKKAVDEDSCWVPPPIAPAITLLRPIPTAKSQRNNVTCNYLLSDNTLYAPSPYSNGEIPNPLSPKSRLPLVGHLHLLDPLIHHSLIRLSKRHGPIFSLYFGSMPTEVASSFELLKLFLQTHEVTSFNTRFQTSVIRRLTCDNSVAMIPLRTLLKIHKEAHHE
ncbi:uncharacterized protein LOC107637173 [Arachis ipaensis]|uniref:uncharacterized protein LOC107637173 n=1 Tax=Arachis ipaensis TaxID=130454 RepID=UPI0007AF4000|nr:uncharacterized protein LOC107637173 [Arachis ipaensis]